MTTAPFAKTSPASRPATVATRAPVVYRDSRWFAAARAIFISTLMVAPLSFGGVQPWAWAALALVAVLVMLCWAMGCVRQQGLMLAWTPLYVPTLLFLGLAVIQLSVRKFHCPAKPGI